MRVEGDLCFRTAHTHKYRAACLSPVRDTEVDPHDAQASVKEHVYFLYPKERGPRPVQSVETPV